MTFYVFILDNDLRYMVDVGIILINHIKHDCRKWI